MTENNLNLDSAILKECLNDGQSEQQKRMVSIDEQMLDNSVNNNNMQVPLLQDSTSMCLQEATKKDILPISDPAQDHQNIDNL